MRPARKQGNTATPRTLRGLRCRPTSGCVTRREMRKWTRDRMRRRKPKLDAAAKTAGEHPAPLQPFVPEPGPPSASTAPEQVSTESSAAVSNVSPSGEPTASDAGDEQRAGRRRRRRGRRGRGGKSTAAPGAQIAPLRPAYPEPE